MSDPEPAPEQPGPNAATEPLLTVGGITAAAVAALAALVAFGIPMSDDKQSAILGIIAVLAPIVVAAVGRGRVYSPATVRTLLSLRRSTPP